MAERESTGEDALTSDKESPPSFEELPKWFQDEISHEIDSRTVRSDIQKSLARTHYHRMLAFGAASNLVALGTTSDMTILALLLLALCGAVVAHVCLRLEVSPPSGVLIAGAISLPVYFVLVPIEELSGMDALPYFLRATILISVGGIACHLNEQHRSQSLPF